MMRALIFGLASALTIAGAAAADPIVNGDFSGGNTGFTTDYNYGNVYPEGTYNVGTNPNALHSGFVSMGDHTTGTGNMMIVNGASNAGAVVWSETVTLLANTTYYLSAWVANLNLGSPAQLQFSINGQTIGSVFGVTDQGTWHQFYAGFASGAGGAETLRIIDQQTAAGGNDFALDDIALPTSAPTGGTSTVPLPGTAPLVAAGLAALALARRRARG